MSESSLMPAFLKVTLAFVAAGYLVGGIPFGFLIGKMRGVDVRTVGSKNIGATNVYRTVGHAWGVLAFFCDFLKGLLPTLAASWFAANGDVGEECADLGVWTGLACVVGHTLTPYMKFRGGKGVATAFGMLMALVPWLVTAAFALFVVTVWPLAAPSLPLKVVMTALGAFVVWKHRSNIARLAKGCENKIY